MKGVQEAYYLLSSTSNKWRIQTNWMDTTQLTFMLTKEKTAPLKEGAVRLLNSILKVCWLSKPAPVPAACQRKRALCPDCGHGYRWPLKVSLPSADFFFFLNGEKHLWRFPDNSACQQPATSLFLWEKNPTTKHWTCFTFCAWVFKRHSHKVTENLWFSFYFTATVSFVVTCAIWPASWRWMLHCLVQLLTIFTKGGIYVLIPNLPN